MLPDRALPTADPEKPTIRHERNAADDANLPLVVDLDGTLVRTDCLWEGVVRMARTRPLGLLDAARAICAGRAALKRWVAKEAGIDAAVLPTNDDFIKYVAKQRSKGRSIHLATAADRAVAERISDHFGLFDSILSSDGGRNLKGDVKARALAERFPNGFAYAGNDAADVPVWRAATAAVIVEAPSWVEREVHGFARVEAVFRGRACLGPSLWRAMRPHQWVKNLLLLIPLILGIALVTWEGVLACLLGVLLLSLAASGTYILNDIVDLDADRRHATKSRRPLACGDLALPWAVAAAFLLCLGSTVGAFLLSLQFGMALILYLAATIAYSLWLKRVALIDTLVIGMLFTLRVQMGVGLVALPFSGWLMAFSTFLFFSLALAKRHAEIVKAAAAGRRGIAGRDYRAEDIPLTLCAGLSSTFAAMVVLMLYLSERPFLQGAYRLPDLLWLSPVLILIWALRIWVFSHRGKLHDDPIVFALNDRVSFLLGGLALLSVVAAAFGVPS